MFQNLFDLEGHRIMEFLKIELKDFREKLNQLLNDSMKKSEYSLRLTVIDNYLGKIQVKTTTNDDINIVAKFEEFREYFDDFKKSIEDLDFDEDNLKKGDEHKIEKLTEYMLTISESITNIANIVDIADQIRLLEAKKS